MKFSTMILLAPLKARLKTKRSPFTVCEYLVYIQSYEGLKLLKLWISEYKNGKKSGTKSIRIDQIYDVTMFACQIGDYSNGSSSLVTYENRMEFCTLMAQYKLSLSCRENCCQGNTVGSRPLLFETIMLQLFFCHKQKLTLCVLLPSAFMSRTSL